MKENKISSLKYNLGIYIDPAGFPIIYIIHLKKPKLIDVYYCI